MNILIGLDIRYRWKDLGSGYGYVGIALYMLSVLISTKSLLNNKYFESSSWIQTERNQTVVSTGAYTVVRHPEYSSILM
ncbi:MAG: hypothetical protein LUG18_11855 [Candidatus Azobacteroides sp.]|nr:hypothetical protein [Candidatus Azobacteroides sp.]